jgi:hypothetical protein
MTIEFFQASQPAALVTTTKGKLAVQFPYRPALSIPSEHGFIDSFSAYLAELDVRDMLKAKTAAPPPTRKAAKEQVTHEDAADIRYISEFIGGIAQAVTADPDLLATRTVYITKRINDHVLSRGAARPWRRSPKWLIVRVALQSTLAQWDVSEEYGYKAFIAFVLARTLKLASTADVSHDVLFVMNAKIAARMWKLSIFKDLPAEVSADARLPFPVDFISDQITSVESQLQNRWQDVQDEEATLLWVAPSPADITLAQSFTLPNSFTYLSEVRERRSALDRDDTSFSSGVFEEQLLKRHLPRPKRSPPLPIPSTTSDPNLWSAILEVETWVADELDEWSTRTLLSNQPLLLRDMIERHQTMIASLGSHNPEIFSRLFLIVLELWVALDKAVTRLIPLLMDYSPELSIDSFEPLILPELGQMFRLHGVESYLTSRHTRAEHQDLSIFSFCEDPSAFPIRYFGADAHMQQLRHQIVAKAEKEQDSKLAELRRKNSLHAQLTAEVERLQHQYKDRRDERGEMERVHIKQCRRCLKDKELAALTIELFEWPLPEEEMMRYGLNVRASIK